MTKALWLSLFGGAPPILPVNGLVAAYDFWKRNALGYPDDLSKTSNWNLAGGFTSVTKNATDPLGVANNAWTVTTDAANHGIYQQIKCSYQLEPLIQSVWLKTVSGTGTLQMTDPALGSPVVDCAVTNSWQRFRFPRWQTHNASLSVGIWVKPGGASPLLTWQMWLPQMQYGLVYDDASGSGAASALASSWGVGSALTLVSAPKYGLTAMRFDGSTHAVTGLPAKGAAWTTINCSASHYYAVDSDSGSWVDGVAQAGATEFNLGTVGGYSGLLTFWVRYSRVLTAAEHRQCFAALKRLLRARVEARFCFDGDSLTVGPALGSGYVEQLMADYADAGRRFDWMNYAVSGQVTNDLNTDATTQIDPYYSALVAPKNILCVWIGCNDMAGQTISKETAYNNLVTYCQGRKAAGYKIIVATILPRGATNPNFETDRAWYNNQIKTNYASWADAVADVAGDSTLGAGYSDLTYYNADQVHLTQAGQAIVKGIFKAKADQFI